MRVFIDGVQSNSVGTSGTTTATTDPVQIAGRTNNADMFDGQISELRLANRAWSASEVLSLKTQPFLEFKEAAELWNSMFRPSEPAPVGNGEGAAMYHHLQNLGVYT